MSIVHLTLYDIEQVLEDLLGRRGEALRSSSIGGSYEPMLTELLERLAALPPALRGRPMTVTLRDIDQRHDAVGRACDDLISAHEHHPDTDEALRAALVAAREALDLSRQALRRAYARQASDAAQRRKVIDVHREALARIPASGEVTLADWLDDFIAQGERIGARLSDRADAESDKARARAGELRLEAIGLLGRMRAAVVDELRFRSDLSADLEREIFAFLDQRAAEAGRSATRGRGAEAPVGDAPPPDTTPDA